jgi:putative SOS response-associated peptidase YedK
MCGRFVAASPPPLLAEHFAVDEIRVDDVQPSWNVAPTDRVPAVAAHGGRRLLGAFRWGLVPSWAPDPSGGARLINARAETLPDKPAFREAFARRRCLIPADGFYEWRLTIGGAKQPVFIFPTDERPVAFAGLWEVWRDRSDPDAPPLRTCTIVTTSANARLSMLHARMPVVLARDAWATWLDHDVHDPFELAALLVPAPDDTFDVRDASRAVNDVRNKGGSSSHEALRRGHRSRPSRRRDGA